MLNGCCLPLRNSARISAGVRPVSVKYSAICTLIRAATSLRAAGASRSTAMRSSRTDPVSGVATGCFRP